MADKKADKKKPGFFARIGKYFRDAKGEFKKIVWPSRKQIWNNVAVVLVMVVIFAIATWGSIFCLLSFAISFSNNFDQVLEFLDG